MDHDPRIEMRYLHVLDPATIARALPAADFLVATFWTTWGPISLASPDRGVKLQLVQAYEVWAAPTEVIHGILLEPTLKVVVAPTLAETLAGIGVPRESIHVVPNGLDHRIFRCTRSMAERAPRVAFMVHLGIQKGLDVAIATLERTRARRPDVAAIGYGIPARPPSLPEWVEYMRLPSPERLADILNGSSIFLCASRNEGWGLPVTEAMACGCAVVSTRNGGVESYAVDHENALLCEVDDVDGLTDAVVALLDDEDQRVQLASGGLETVRAFDWRSTASKFEQILLASSS
jgi:glycosyltransferase involved in cell wall biosynthesis